MLLLKKVIISSLPSYNYHVIYMHTLPPVGTIMTSGSGLEDNILLLVKPGLGLVHHLLVVSMILVIELLMLMELTKVRAHVKWESLHCICGFDTILP